MIITSFNRWAWHFTLLLPHSKTNTPQFTNIAYSYGKILQNTTIFHGRNPVRRYGPVPSYWATWPSCLIRWFPEAKHLNSKKESRLNWGDPNSLYIIVHPDYRFAYCLAYFEQDSIYIPILYNSIYIPMFWRSHSLKHWKPPAPLGDPSGMDKPHWWTLIESPWGSRIRGFQEFLQPELNKTRRNNLLENIYPWWVYTWLFMFYIYIYVIYMLLMYTHYVLYIYPLVNKQLDPDFITNF